MLKKLDDEIISAVIISAVIKGSSSLIFFFTALRVTQKNYFRFELINIIKRPTFAKCYSITRFIHGQEIIFFLLYFFNFHHVQKELLRPKREQKKLGTQDSGVFFTPKNTVSAYNSSK